MLFLEKKLKINYKMKINVWSYLDEYKALRSSTSCPNTLEASKSSGTKDNFSPLIDGFWTNR